VTGPTERWKQAGFGGKKGKKEKLKRAGGVEKETCGRSMWSMEGNNRGKGKKPREGGDVVFSSDPASRRERKKKKNRS